jgi:hypothetical protein
VEVAAFENKLRLRRLLGGIQIREGVATPAARVNMHLALVVYGESDLTKPQCTSTQNPF